VESLHKLWEELKTEIGKLHILKQATVNNTLVMKLIEVGSIPSKEVKSTGKLANLENLYHYPVVRSPTIDKPPTSLVREVLTHLSC